MQPLLIGPPISIAIMAATIVPNKIFELVPKFDKNVISELFRNVIGGLNTNVIIMLINNVPNSGYRSTGLIPSSDFGKMKRFF